MEKIAAVDFSVLLLYRAVAVRSVPKICKWHLCAGSLGQTGAGGLRHLLQYELVKVTVNQKLR